MGGPSLDHPSGGYAGDSSGPPKASGATVTAPESYVEARVTEPKAPDPPTEANTERLAPDSAPGDAGETDGVVRLCRCPDLWIQALLRWSKSCSWSR